MAWCQCKIGWLTQFGSIVLGVGSVGETCLNGQAGHTMQNNMSISTSTLYTNKMDTVDIGTCSPEVVATVLLCEVDLLWCELDLLFDVDNWTGPMMTELNQHLYKPFLELQSHINLLTHSPIDKDRVRERSNSQVRVGVLIQVHVSCQRVAEELHA